MKDGMQFENGQYVRSMLAEYVIIAAGRRTFRYVSEYLPTRKVWQIVDGPALRGTYQFELDDPHLPAECKLYTDRLAAGWWWHRTTCMAVNPGNGAALVFVPPT